MIQAALRLPSQGWPLMPRSSCSWADRGSGCSEGDSSLARFPESCQLHPGPAQPALPILQGLPQSRQAPPLQQAPPTPPPQLVAQRPFFQRVHFTAVSFSEAVQTNFCLIAHKRRKCTSVL